MAAARVLIGRILKAHGVRGEVAFAAAGDDPGIIGPGSVVYLGETGTEALTLRAARAGDRTWLLSFDEVTDRESAESLAGGSLFVDEESLPPLPAGEYYQFQLVDLAVTCPNGEALGRVARVVEMPGHDLLEVQGAAGDILVPVRREFVEWIDLERGEIRLTDRADLLEAQAKAAGPAADRRGAGAGRMRPQRKRRGKPPAAPSSGSTS